MKNQLFHPFSQENPLQTGTGLGLAIVNGIVQSESVGGKVDVWSEEGVGTEVKVTFTGEKIEVEQPIPEMNPLFDASNHPTISLVGFETGHRGGQKLKTVMQNYLTSWWGFELQVGPKLGEIVISNNDTTFLIDAIKRRDIRRPFIILSDARGNIPSINVVSEFESMGGFCRILYKPGGPARLRNVLKLCLHASNISKQQRVTTSPRLQHERLCSGEGTADPVYESHAKIRRNSEDKANRSRLRPLMTPRSTTVHLGGAIKPLPGLPPNEQEEPPPTIAVGSGGALLESSIHNPTQPRRHVRVLVVEDNNILRNLL